MAPSEVSHDQISSISEILLNSEKPLKERFRALFTLKNIGNEDCINEIAKGFRDPSALLKHELAYCLGQMQDTKALPILIQVLEDGNQDSIVRHEAGEALGAIGSPDALPVLQKYSIHPIQEISETCKLAIQRIEWLIQHNIENTTGNDYHSIDPAPPLECKDIKQLENILLNENEELFLRYRAMFALRNNADEDSVRALSKGLNCKSALFRHEIAFVLGQLQHPAATDALIETLQNKNEHSMVRHESAEALGAIASEKCMTILKEYQEDSERVVKESCDVALDMCEYENSHQFQYADSLVKLAESL